jgi:phosphoribosylanthranilate isomerase
LHPASPRFITPDDAASIATKLGPFALTVAVFGQVVAGANVDAFSAVQGVGAIQVQGKRRIETLRLNELTPPSSEDLSRAQEADAVLLDAYHPSAYGGTGHRVDWEWAAEFVRQSGRPVVLAGGLDPDNVVDAIRRVRPYAVDVASGVEASPGRKDRAKVRDFILSVRSTAG